jgi:hypothetical protein
MNDAVVEPDLSGFIRKSITIYGYAIGGILQSIYEYL